MTSNGDITIDGRLIKPAKVDGLSDVYKMADFTFVKARWVPDDEVSACIKCRSKFSQLRRKHHCRQCGKIFCGKCCNEKIRLVHIGCEEAGRVCSSCRHLVELITNARSPSQPLAHLAAKGFADLLRDAESLINVVEQGGVQTLVSLSRQDDPSTQAVVIKCLHFLSKYETLHIYLAEAGGIKSICHILVRANGNDDCVFLDGLGALSSFCTTSNEHKRKALQDGALQAVVAACVARTESATHPAIRTLCLFLDIPETHPTVINNTHGILQRLVSLTASHGDDQIKEAALKALCYLSSDDVDMHRHKIIQENYTLGCCLQKALQDQSSNPQILINATCVVANLATNIQDQKGLQDLMKELADLFNTAHATNNECILLNIARGIANFAAFKPNADVLCNSLPAILSKCMQHENSSVRTHAMRAAFHLMSHTPFRAIPIITREGSEFLLNHLVDVDGLLEYMQRFLLSRVPSKSKP